MASNLVASAERTLYSYTRCNFRLRSRQRGGREEDRTFPCVSLAGMSSSAGALTSGLASSRTGTHTSAASGNQIQLVVFNSCEQRKIQGQVAISTKAGGLSCLKGSAPDCEQWPFVRRRRPQHTPAQLLWPAQTDRAKTKSESRSGPSGWMSWWVV